MNFKDNQVLIVPSSIKNNILKKINELGTLINIKLYTLNEFIKKVQFDYDKKTIYYLKKKLNIKPEIAEMYLKNMYYVDKDINNEKVQFLNDLKKELKDNNLLIENKMFIESLKNKELVFYNVPKTKYLNKILSNLKLNYIFEEKENKSYINKIYHIKNVDEEIVFVANKICELIKNGIDINNIYLTNLSPEHRTTIKRIFNMYKIPFVLNENESIFGTSIVQLFINNYNSNIQETLSVINENIKNESEEKIYNRIINILNEYYFVEDYNEVKDMVINDLKNTSIPTESLKNAVRENELLDYEFTEEDYVFVLNANQGVLPTIIKDEEFLSDKIKELLSIDTSIDKNIELKNKTINSIKSIKNLYLSYVDKSLSATFYPSSILSDLEFEEEKVSNEEYTNSNLYNKIKLTSFLDEYKKYNVVDKNLPILNNNYTLGKYNNNFTSINPDLLKEFLQNELRLSYTSLNTYYECSFKYYINNILKLNIFEETFMQEVGNIFHEVLEKYFKNKTDFEELYKTIINKSEFPFTVKDRFFLKKIKSELAFIITTIENQNLYSSLDKELFEENVVVNIPDNIKISFSGKIDKLKYKETDDKTIVAIIDYKTGNPDFNLNHVIYGIDMQLPIYVYLAKNSNKIKNIEIAGMYLQKILNNEIIADNKHSYEQLKKDKLKLQGYSNEDYSIISQFDSSYVDSNVIKSLKVSSKGFYSYSKVLSNNNIDKVVSIVEKNIKDGSENILSGKFDINPKKIGKELVGCTFCKFKNICYMKEKDIVELEEYKNMEFLGGEQNA